MVTCSASPNQPGGIVARNGTAALITIIGKKLVFRGSEIFADSPGKFIIFNLKTDVSDKLHFAEFISDFHFIFNHLVT
jgi:hypothetical protein